MKKIISVVPNIYRYNEIVEQCAFDRLYAFDSYMRQYITIECIFAGFGKNLGKYNVLLTNIKFNGNEAEHMWLRNAAAASAFSNSWRTWYNLIPGTVIQLSGYVSYYDDKYARKPTLINTNVTDVIWVPQSYNL
jgi:hypothetical protein